MSARPGPLQPGDLTVVAAGREYHFGPDRPLLIGRAVDCDVVLTDTKVSRHHVELVPDMGWIIHDLETPNGTWHGTTRLTAWPVGAGLSLRLGDPASGPVVELLAADEGDIRLDTEELGLGRAEPTPREPIPLGDRVTIGRAADNDLPLNDLLVSRWHARIVKTSRGHLVQDLGSANLTFVNGHPITAALLNDGDVLTCGQSRLVRVGDRLHLLPKIGAGLVVDHLTFALPGSGPPTSQLSFRLEGRSLLAVIGPTGAGKSTLLRLLSGDVRPLGGRIRYQSLDVQANAAVRTRIGVIPRHSVVHERLTARDVLRHAAALRLPTDTTAQERDTRVNEVLDELGLTNHADVRVDRLHADLPRRLSIGVELLTRPTLLLLDQPTTGLDPNLARNMMVLLRQLADAGRQVVVTTHSPADVKDCDDVLVLAPGGSKTYHGAPGDMEKRFGTSDWATIFEHLSSLSTARAGIVRASDPGSPPSARSDIRQATVALRDPAVRQRTLSQAQVVIRRQLRLLLADWWHSTPLALLPVVVAVLAVAVSEPAGLAIPGGGNNAGALRLLTVLVIGVVAMAAWAPLRNLVAERPIYQHEHAAGLLPEAYLIGKVAVFAGIAAAQALLTLLLVRIARPGPASAIFLGLPTLELVIAIIATALTSCCVGLALSATAPTREYATPLLLVVLTIQLLLCGGLVSLAGRPFLAIPAMLTPARWGLAALAATTDVMQLSTVPHDSLWAHKPGIWLISLIMVTVLGLGCMGFTLERLRR